MMELFGLGIVFWLLFVVLWYFICKRIVEENERLGLERPMLSATVIFILLIIPPLTIFGILGFIIWAFAMKPDMYRTYPELLWIKEKLFGKKQQ